MVDVSIVSQQLHLSTILSRKSSLNVNHKLDKIIEQTRRTLRANIQLFLCLLLNNVLNCQKYMFHSFTDNNALI